MRYRCRVLWIGLILLFTGWRAPHAAGETVRLEDVVYGHKDGMALVMDVLKPAKPNGIGVVYMVSGGWTSSVDFIRSGLLGPPQMKAFYDRGDTVFLVMHSSQPKFTVPELLPDIHRAVRFIRVHAHDYGVDPNRLGIAGASSGGHLSLMIGVTGKDGDPAAPDPVDRASSRVQAVACFFPPTDLVNYGKTDRTFLEYEPTKPFETAWKIEHLPRDEQIKVLRDYSPLYAITRHTPPTLILHGDEDPLVPLEQSERFAARLQELNIPHQLIIHKGGGHGWPEMDRDFSALADWFDKYLPPAPSAH